jgi:hypothetical protein
MAFQPALAVESISETPYVAYRATYTSSDEIVTAKDSAGAWRSSRLTADNIPAYSPTIAVDHNGKVHVAWIGQDASANWKIQYANNVIGNWRIQLLTTSALGQFGSGAAPFIAVTQTGVTHIFYRGGDYPNYHIHHATNTVPGDTAWSYEVITTPNGADYTSDAVIDGSGALHLLVSGNDGFGFPPHAYYLRKPLGGIWTAPELANPGGTGSGGSLIVDRFGRAHITWDEVSGNIITGNLYYATNRNGSWASTPIQTDAQTFNGVLAIDATGRGHAIAYNGSTFASQEIIVIHSSGVLTQVNEGTEGVARGFILHQNYPNPFNPNTIISCELSIDNLQLVTLKVFDLLGREVTTLVNEVQGSGLKTVEFDASGLASGVYLYRLQAGRFSETRKMLLLR